MHHDAGDKEREGFALVSLAQHLLRVSTAEALLLSRAAAPRWNQRVSHWGEQLMWDTHRSYG